MAPSSLTGQARAMMQVIYARAACSSGAAKFMDFMRIAVGEDASVEHVDDFLGSFNVLLDLRVVH